MNDYDLDDEEFCSACNGSGEGMYDGATCYKCKGTGEEPRIRSLDDLAGDLFSDD
jgi:DnaJ-class molecular chaperone